MKEIFTNLMMSIFGFILILFGSTGLLGIIGIFLGFIGGFLMLIPILKDISIITGEGLTAFWQPKKPGKKISFTITKYGKLLFLPVEDKHEGLLYHNGKFFADNKGDQLQTQSGRDCVLSIAGLGVTLTTKMAGYTALLKKERKVDNYDDAVKKYLGPSKWSLFQQKFRGKNQPKDKYGVHNELDFLLDEQPQDVLKEKIVGETITFRDFLNYLKYAYNTLAVENAIDRERIDMMDRLNDYSQKAKNAVQYAIAIIIVIIGIGIAAYIFSGVDMGGMLNFFGGA